MHNDIPHLDIPIIFLSPKLCCTMNEFKVKLNLKDSNTKIKIGKENNMLQINGNIQIKNLNMDGAVVIEVGSNGSVNLEKLKIENLGVKLIPLKKETSNNDEIDKSDKIKGWKLIVNQIYYSKTDNNKLTI